MVTKRARMAEFYRRLGELPRCADQRATLQQLRETLDEVEDELSGVASVSPPPPGGGGRMYFPLPDRIRRLANGSIEAVTVGHIIEAGTDGSVTIRSRATGEVEFRR